MRQGGTLKISFECAPNSIGDYADSEWGFGAGLQYTELAPILMGHTSHF